MHIVVRRRPSHLGSRLFSATSVAFNEPVAVGRGRASPITIAGEEFDLSGHLITHERPPVPPVQVRQQRSRNAYKREELGFAARMRAREEMLHSDGAEGQFEDAREAEPTTAAGASSSNISRAAGATSHPERGKGYLDPAGVTGPNDALKLSQSTVSQQQGGPGPRRQDASFSRGAMRRTETIRRTRPMEASPGTQAQRGGPPIRGMQSFRGRGGFQARGTGRGGAQGARGRGGQARRGRREDSARGSRKRGEDEEEEEEEEEETGPPLMPSIPSILEDPFASLPTLPSAILGIVAPRGAILPPPSSPSSLPTIPIGPTYGYRATLELIGGNYSRYVPMANAEKLDAESPAFRAIQHNSSMNLGQRRLGENTVRELVSGKGVVALKRVGINPSRPKGAVKDTVGGSSPLTWS